MRTHLRRGLSAALVASSLCLMAACSDSSDSSDKSGGDAKSSQSAEKPSKAPAVALSVEQMKAASLAVEDLPAGWKVDKTEADPTTEPKADKAECQPLAAFLADKVAGATMGASLDFAGDKGKTALSQQVFTFPGEGAADYLKTVGAALEKCDAFGYEDDGAKFKVTLEKLTGPKVAEESHAFRMKLEVLSVDVKFESDMLVARQGTGVTRIAYIPSDPSGHKNFEELATRGGQKFARRAQY
ncbi:hypothetical protein ACPXCE_20135 [Streptomyces sp. DT24]|uniref:hypothetical protein n=1 Tax=unclassified Streptomyces TaxID=2593676 RepID=UPI003CF4C211